MSTTPRQYQEGHWYHVYARSLDEVPLFVDDEERRWFIRTLDDIFHRREVGLGSFCLMDTHYHALVRMGSVPLDRALQGLHMSYARHVNDRRDRSGPVFRPPPGVDIVLSDAYLLTLVPYIHANPVKAGLVESPRDWRWNTDGRYRDSARTQWDLACWEYPPNYRDTNRTVTYTQQLNEEIKKPPGDDGYIGEPGEWEQQEKRDEQRKQRYRDRRGRDRKEDIARRIAREHDVRVEALKEPGRTQPQARIRQQIMVEMYEEGYGPTEIGDYFNRNKGTVVHAVNTFREESNN